MSSQTLPPVVVYGNSPDPYYGLGDMAATYGSGSIGPGPWGNVDPQLAFFKNMPNGKAVFAALQNKDRIALITAFFEGLSGRNASYINPMLKGWGNFGNYMVAGGYKQLGGADQNGMHPGPDTTLTSLVPLSAIYVKGGKINYTSNPDFWNSPLVFISGINYWINGGGQARTISMAALDIKTLDVNTIAPLAQAIASNAPGSYPFSNATFNLSLWNAGSLDAAGLLGNVIGEVSGTLKINTDGSWSFAGDFGIRPDLYDANASNRTFWQEGLTTFLRKLGDTFGHTNYYININGRQALNLSGHR